MTVEADIYTAIKSLVSNRLYPDVAPAGTVAPFATFQQVGGDVVTFMESAMPSKRNGRFQVNVLAKTRIEASSIARQIEAALVTSTTLRAEPMGAMIADYDDQTLLYGSRQFFSIWFAV